jgi:AmmeMemoRadiSam system protein B
MVELSFPLAEHPRLRPVEVIPVQDGGQRSLVLRDPSDPELKQIVLSGAAGDILMLLYEGKRTIEGIAAALQLRGVAISASQLRRLCEQLDQAGYLEGPRAEFRLNDRLTRFRAQPSRPAVHAGGAYAGTPDELERMVVAGYRHRDGPHALPGRNVDALTPPRAIIAPHVDLHRGAPTYSWAYKAIAEAPPAELYVVLGTCHAGVQGSFAATEKAYDTPLGPVLADTAFLERLGRLWGRDLFAGEFAHANEHSIEFQAVYLRSLGISAPMAPILCDSLHSLVPDGASPRSVPVVDNLIHALLQAVAEDGRSVTFIAAVDLAHIGRRFGDTWLVDAAQAARVGRADHELLDLVLKPDAEAYYQHVMRDRDARRICGFTPIYLLSALMGKLGGAGELLRYTQWVDRDLSSSVTFVSALYP